MLGIEHNTVAAFALAVVYIISSTGLDLIHNTHPIQNITNKITRVVGKPSFI
jgi:hypothetical protein